MTDTQSEKAAQRAEVSSSLIEPAAGIAVVVLAILGLAGVSEPLLMSIARQSHDIPYVPDQLTRVVIVVVGS